VLVRDLAQLPNHALSESTRARDDSFAEYAMGLCFLFAYA